MSFHCEKSVQCHNRRQSEKPAICDGKYGDSAAYCLSWKAFIVLPSVVHMKSDRNVVKSCHEMRLAVIMFTVFTVLDWSAYVNAISFAGTGSQTKVLD